MKKIIYRILHILLLVVITIIFAGAIYLKKNFPATPFDELIFYYKNGVENSDSSVFIDAIKVSLPLMIICIILFYTLLYDITFGKIVLYAKAAKKKFQLYPIKFLNKHRRIFTGILFAISFCVLLYCVNFFTYIKYANTKSDFIEKKYVNPKKVDIEFGEKRNLIFIVVESLETSFFTKKQGGYWNYEVTPGLYKLLNDEDSVVFYNKNKAQQMKMLKGASWTTASVVANSTGVPFKIPIEDNSYHSNNFMNGTYALGDLLKDNGYYNEVISAANTSFGGLKEYFTKHGKYKIVDTDSLNDFNLKIKDSDYGNWGFNDNYLFETAKKRLDIISKNDQPFNLELITIDTHFIDGFIGNYSLDKFETQYENVYATTSKLIYDFVKWVQEQDYYEDTTIVIVGDHLLKENDYFEERKATDRSVYSCIINPGIEAKTTKNRVFTALDTYPTIVSAIGGKIKGDKLGLGVNLFSDKKTLSEIYTFDYLNKELQKKSNFYNKNILDDNKYFSKVKLVESR